MATLQVKEIDAHIYHYGWVRHPNKQYEKIVDFSGLWNGEGYNPAPHKEENQFDFLKDADSLVRFKGSHPAVMQKRIEEKNWDAKFNTRKKNFSFKDSILYRIEKLTGKRLFAYKNYKVI